MCIVHIKYTKQKILKQIIIQDSKMDNIDEITVRSLTTWLIVLFVVFLILRYNWKRRWLYFYASKFEGPPSWPLIGSAHIVFRSNDLYKDLFKMMSENKAVFKIWLGTELLIMNSQPEDIEIIMNTLVDRPHHFKYATKVIGEGLVTSPGNIWKGHRKMLNPAFNVNVLKSFIPFFVKYSKEMVKNLKVNEKTDLMFDIWKYTLNSGCEAIADVTSEQITGQEKFITGLIRVEEILIEWMFNFSLRLRFLRTFFKFLTELKFSSSQMYDFTRKLIKIKKQTMSTDVSENENNNKQKKALMLLLAQKEKNGAINDDEILTEVLHLLIGASETSAHNMYYTLVILGIYPKIQEQIHAELDSIFGESEEDVGWEHIIQMDYLERVIKETLRLFPPVPIAGRSVKKNVKLNSRIYPEGCSIFVPVFYLHRASDLWDNPHEFNPDRFLPEETEKRHRCSYLPFGSGPRNCIGFRYAMISTKILVATILRNYTITAFDYKSIDDIQLFFGLAITPEHSYKIVLKRRKPKH